jgi:predicted glycogen debranching enzyme
MIRFGREICGDLEAARRREWLETDALGGFASSTLLGLNTRRYHGLLVASLRPPVERYVLLSKLEETLVIGERRFELGVNQYPGAVHPEGYRYLEEFRLDPFPVWVYRVEGVELEKSLCMLQGENSTVVQYRVRAPAEGLRLEVRPLLAFRDYHSLTHENPALNPQVQQEAGRATVTPYADLPSLHFVHDADALDGTGFWYRRFEYQEERERGLDFQEDLYSPFSLLFDLGRRSTASLLASTEARDVSQVAFLVQAERGRREALAAASPVGNELVRALALAADAFVVARGDQKTVIAGYPWFCDWGRDTMIALPGLALVTGKPDVARSILLEFARHVDQGMLPNRFPDAGEAPEYNTVDASLWYFQAVQALLQYTDDTPWVLERLYPVLADMVDWHLKGTRYGIRVDEDGLLLAGEAGVQLTWMDAKVGDWVVTPRRGKAVEIQALWYNALCLMERLARAREDSGAAERYRKVAGQAKGSFNSLFWNEEAGCLYDAVDGDFRDSSLRPNQVLAASLPSSMLSREKAKAMLEVVERELLTPYGLRSLSPNDPRYQGRYEGDARTRDGAYHQGTVWAWLMGPFLTAYLKANGRSVAARTKAAEWLEGFREHLLEAGLGQVSEIFDGDSPHRPRGCIAQAWSVAELLRAAVEDVFRP